MDDRVAGRRAPLSSPRHFAPNNFLGGIRQVGRLVNDGGVLSPELEQYWSEMLGSCPHHHLPQ